MKKGKKLLVTLLSTIAMLGIGATTLTACGNPGGDSGEVTETFSITWTVPQHATVTMDNGGEKPATASKGTNVVFTVAVDNGYALDSVKANGKRVSSKAGKYTVAITKETTIEIAVKEAVGELKVTTKPTKLTYIAGDEIDLTGMVVEVTYGTGRKETLNYGTSGYTVFPTTFEGGEESFDVMFSGTTIKVNLDKRVEYLVTIDPDGGVISETWLNKVAAMNLNNYSVSDAGVVTFTYFNNLSRAISLPTKDEISKTDHSFTQWSFDGTISNTTATNVAAKAGWQVQLVEIESLSMVVEEGVPYLTLSGTFRAANEVYLYLYEGNKNIELIGDTYRGHSGEALNIKFDLRKLSDKGDDYNGAWMDVRFNAKYQDKDTTMELFVNNLDIEMGTKIKTGGYVYLFANWNGALKVYFKTASPFAYTVQGHSVDGDDFLQLKGAGFSQYAGKYVEITWWQDFETDGYGAIIAADGSWTVEYPLSVLNQALKKNTFAHITIYEDASRSGVVWGGTNQNVEIFAVDTAFPTLPKKQGDITNAIKYVGTDKLSYYIGYAWDGLMLYVVDESVILKDTSVRLDGGKVYYVLSGTCVGYTTETFVYGFYFQHANNVDGLGEGCVYNDYEGGATPTINQHASITGETFEMTICVSDLFEETFKQTNDTKWGLLSKYYFGTSTQPIEIRTETVGEDSVTLNGIRYSAYRDGTQTWDISTLVLEKVANN